MEHRQPRGHREAARAIEAGRTQREEAYPNWRLFVPFEAEVQLVQRDVQRADARRKKCLNADTGEAGKVGDDRMLPLQPALVTILTLFSRTALLLLRSGLGRSPGWCPRSSAGWSSRREVPRRRRYSTLRGTLFSAGSSCTGKGSCGRGDEERGLAAAAMDTAETVRHTATIPAYLAGAGQAVANVEGRDGLRAEPVDMSAGVGL